MAPREERQTSNAGLKIEGLCGNMEGGYAFFCKNTKLRDACVSLCGPLPV